MTTTKPKRQRTEKRVGTYWQKPPQITPSEARRVAESRNAYLTAAKIASDAVRAGLLRLPVKKGDL